MKVNVGRYRALAQGQNTVSTAVRQACLRAERLDSEVQRFVDSPIQVLIRPNPAELPGLDEIGHVLGSMAGHRLSILPRVLKTIFDK